MAKIPWEEEATITTSFTLKPKEQFDQAGIMVVVDENVWVKAGIEYTDGFPNLSCVVTMADIVIGALSVYQSTRVVKTSRRILPEFT